MDPHVAALQDRACRRVSRILAVTGSKTIEVQRSAYFVQAIVYAVNKPRPEAASENTPGFSTCFGQAGFKFQSKVSFEGGAEPPTLIRGFNQKSAPRPIAKGRHLNCCRRRFPFHFELISLHLRLGIL